jgi:hypothetical protein
MPSAAKTKLRSVTSLLVFLPPVTGRQGSALMWRLPSMLALCGVTRCCTARLYQNCYILPEGALCSGVPN